MSHKFDKESLEVVQAYQIGTEVGHCAYIDYLEKELEQTREKIKAMEAGK